MPAVIVYRIRNNEPEYLLVDPKKEVAKEGNKEVINEWIFPKGNIEDGEEHWETAVREVHEETGVVGSPICVVGSDKLKVGTETVRAKYYLIEATSQGEPGEIDVRAGLPLGAH